MMNPPNKGACSMYMMNRNRHMRGRVFLIDDESESRNEGAYLRFTMNRNRQMRGRVLRYRRNRNRQMRGCV